MDAVPYIPYCGAAPVPNHVSWNADPVLAVCLVLFAVSYATAVRRRPVDVWRQGCFWSGWVILSLALISPLCNLSVALFSARVAQHVILTLVAAPLLVLGAVEQMFAPLLEAFIGVRGTVNRYWPRSCSNAVAAVVFALAMWLWHVPSFYDATFRSTFIYWTMHTSMIGAALALWGATLRGQGSLAETLGSIFATMLQMSLLGVLLTFARIPLFDVHANTTWPWGLSPLADQQLGGLVMWVAGSVLLAGYATLSLLRNLADVDQRRVVR